MSTVSGLEIANNIEAEWRDRLEAAVKSEREALFKAQNAAIGLTRQLEIYEAALEQIILCREDSLEATKAKQALAQVRGVLL